MNLTVLRKEDDLYFQGDFWINGNSVKEIKRGRFEVIGITLPCDFSGKYVSDIGRSKSSLTHKRLWSEYAKELSDKPFNYLPRGRVSIYNGIAFIHLNSLFNQPYIIDAIVEKYCIDKLDIELDFNDTYQGSHYDFLLTWGKVITENLNRYRAIQRRISYGGDKLNGRN